VPPLAEFCEPHVERRELLARADDQRLRLAELLLALLALLELAPVAFERERLALALLLLRGELAHHRADELAAVLPQSAQVVEDDGR
jgi:hypothetical protein